MKEIINSILAFSLLMGVAGCQQEEAMVLNDTYKEYYDTENNEPAKGIIIEYGELPSLDVKEYLSDEQSEEYIENTTATLHAMKEEEMVEEPIELGEILDVGDYYLLLKHEDESIRLFVSVRDTVAPEFKDFTETLSYEQGTEAGNLASLFSAEDLAETTITVEGDVDYNTPGEYKVKVVATDASDNKTEKECTITITAKPVASTGGSSGSGSRPSSGGSTSSSSTSGNTSSGGSNSGGSSSSGGSSGGSTYVQEPSGYRSDLAQQAFNLINKERNNNGMNSLAWNNDLTNIVNNRSKELVSEYQSNNVHQGFYDRYGYVSNYAEIAAYTSGGDSSYAVNGWINSKAHHDIMLMDRNVNMAVSCYYDSSTGGYYWIAMFYYTKG